MSRLPDFIIFGAGKSGTTWLHNALQQHRDIFMPDGEIPFFEDPHYRENDLTPLANACAGAQDEKLVGIKRPNYLGEPACAPRIARDLPNVKLLALLRDPVDRAISQYFHLLRGGRIAPGDPNELFASLMTANADPVIERYILKYGRYAENLEQYRAALDDGRILLLTDDELKDDAKSVYVRACNFLDVSADNLPWDLTIPRNQGAYSPLFLGLMNRLNRARTNFDDSMPKQKSGARARLAEKLVWGVSKLSSASRLVEKKRSSPLSDEILERLRAYYTPDLERLKALAGMDVSAWIAR